MAGTLAWSLALLLALLQQVHCQVSANWSPAGAAETTAAQPPPLGTTTSWPDPSLQLQAPQADALKGVLSSHKVGASNGRCGGEEASQRWPARQRAECGWAWRGAAGGAAPAVLL